MRSAVRRTSEGSIPGRAVQYVLVAMIAAALLWLISVYGSGLRDPRYLDGWMLVIGMGLQLYFHVAIKRATLSPRSAIRWRRIHILVGYLLIPIFASHSDFSLPDTGFEWALWVGFVLITLSGIVGSYLTWSLQTKHSLDENIAFDRIPARRAELAQELHSLVVETDPMPTLIALPAPPHDAWIMDLYTTHLRGFFSDQRHMAAHLIGSKRPIKKLTDEIDHLSRYVDQRSQEKLAVIKRLTIEKDRLDFARVYLGLTRAWLFVHVPVTYSLIVLAVMHVTVVYAYSAGLW